MILQREKSVPVWGWATPGESITVEFAGQNKTCTANPEGRWQANLDPLVASALGQTLAITATQTKREFSDVIVGDIWVCSGQSNMQENLERTSDGPIFARADVPTIRFFSAIAGNDDNGTEMPIDDFAKTRGEWRVCNPQSADKLSSRTIWP